MVFSRRGAEADGEFLRSLPPDFAEKSPAVFRHQDFHPVVGILSRRGGDVMVSPAGFAAAGRHRYNAGDISISVQNGTQGQRPECPP